MTDLAPCPFCGNAAELEDHRLCWFVRCSSCGAGVMGDRAPEPDQDLPENYWESFRRSAVERWNQRHPAPVPVAERLPSLAEIFSETDRPDKISLHCDLVTKTVTVRYEDLDDGWFNDLCNLGSSLNS